MIRFHCPLCGKMLKVKEDRHSKSIVCPRCGETCAVPGGAGSSAGDEGASAHHKHTMSSDEVPGLFAGMRPAVRWAAGLLAATSVLSLLMAVLHPELPGLGSSASTGWGLFLAVWSFLLLGVILHGQATGCPWCGKWWSRAKKETKFVDRQVVEDNDHPLTRSLYQTTYLCDHCKRTWSVQETEEHRTSAPGGLHRARH
jgi:hypothetical protein